MKNLTYILTALILVFTGCSKDNETPRSGIATIDNTTFQSTTYYIFGFSFPRASKISTLEAVGPDITVYVNPVNATSLYLMANNRLPSFLKVGEYGSETEAVNAFKNLKEVPQSVNWIDIAEPVKPYQVWVYRSNEDEYTKIRIISTKAEQRMSTLLNRFVDYGECTFEWVHQPDGSIKFP
ncbi:MAG TPA: hypothetical protein VK213_04275 [Bacteroidales bacterium]|nr:hypothetical protein [Bacteroidales bacterium]